MTCICQRDMLSENMMQLENVESANLIVRLKGYHNREPREERIVRTCVELLDDPGIGGADRAKNRWIAIVETDRARADRPSHSTAYQLDGRGIPRRCSHVTGHLAIY